MGNPIDFLQDNIFYTPEKIRQINEAQRAEAGRTRRTPETQAQKTERINSAVTDYFTPSSTSVGGAAAMMSGRSPTAQRKESSGDKRKSPSGTVITIDGKRYDTAYHSKEIAELRKKNPGGGNAAQSTTTYTPLSEPSVRQEEVRTNSNGVEQRGYRTTLTKGDGDDPFLEGKGGLFDRLGLGTDVKMNTGWASNQLPGTGTSVFAGEPISQKLDPDGIGLDTKAVEHKLSHNLYEDGGAVTFKEGREQSLSGLSKEAFIDSQKKGEKAEGPRDWMKPREISGDEARKRAFLDAPSSMAGMRAVDAHLGRVRSGNDFYYTNPNAGQEGQDEFIKVDLKDGRLHQNGQLTGQQLLNQYVTKIKNDVQGDSIVEGEFTQPPQDVPMTSANPADFPETRAFSPDETAVPFTEPLDLDSESDEMRAF